MKVTLDWLKQYVDFNWSPDDLRERLTLLGLEVESMEKTAGEFEGIVVAQILSSEKHPNADKLSVCRVNDGRTERQIVCGAKNYQVGDKVPLALPGAALPPQPDGPGLTIKVSKMRGVESQGMMCSPKELGLAEDAQGLMILAPDAKVGQPFAQHLGRTSSDVVYDLEITPNRPDWNSVLGIAREISALTGNPLRIPNVPSNPESSNSSPSSTDSTERYVQVRLDDAELCPRYVARMIREVKIGPSPDWLRARLESVGIRSINNVVDVTNFVMLETGQPLHAFDYHLLTPAPGRAQPPVIVVRRAAEGEKFTTLDGQERTLTAQMLLIADETKAVALAGVMGGQNSEINLNTSDVLLESAYFKPQNIRATSKHLDLRTDASYRFERGADIEMADWASRRAAQLIVQVAGGRWLPGVVDAYPRPFIPQQITLRHARASDLLGIELSPAQNVEFLRKLGLPVSENGISCTVTVPSFRVDLKREVDLIEEIARLYGVDRIPATPPRGAIGSNPYDLVHDQIAEIRRILTGLGLTEGQGQTLISSQAAELVLRRDPAQADAAPIALARPLSSDMNVLRPSLMPGLLDALRHNLNHQNRNVALFEVGRVFGQGTEERRLAIALTGQRYPEFWSGPEREVKCDIYDLKGILEELFESFGLRGISYQRRPAASEFYVESAVVQLGKLPLGELGQLMPTLAKRYDLRDAVYLAELNLDQLLARRSTVKSFKPLASFPSIRRDVAMLVSESTTHEAVLAAVKQAKAPYLETVELFDVFRGKTVPEGQKSVAYAFTYRHPERTLTDAEANAAHERLLAEFKNALRATIR